MQKVLLASTALVLTTGWAMADVTNAGDGVGASIRLSGEASMGIIGNDSDNDIILVDLDGDGEFDPGELIESGERDAAARFWTDIDLKFTMTGMTDGGLEFGAEVDLDETNNGLFEDGETQGGETLWLRGAFGNLYMGDTDGAFDWAMQESLIGGSIGDVAEHSGYSGNSGLDPLYGGQVARYDYSWGDFGVAVSANIDDFDNGDPVLGIGARYAFASMGFDATIGGGVQWVDGIGERPILGGALGETNDVGLTIWGLSGNLDFGAIQVIADYSHIEYSDFDLASSGSHWGMAVGYETGPWLFAVNYGHAEDFVEIDTSVDPNTVIIGDAEGYALTANYDLGGGASLQGAISHNNVGALDESFVEYSFGVAMTF
jgi:outer membrane protein OmpU